MNDNPKHLFGDPFELALEQLKDKKGEVGIKISKQALEKAGYENIMNLKLVKQGGAE